MMEPITWSRDMILKSLEYILPEEDYNKLPTKFLDIIDGMNTIFTHTELKQRIFRHTQFETFSSKQVLADMERLVQHESFTEIVGLEGVINITPARLSWRSGEKVTSPHSPRRWLSLFAIILDVLQRTSTPNLPECALYVAFFEADKLAKQLTNNYLLEIRAADIENMCRQIFSTIKICDSGPIDKTRKLADITAQLFDDTNYYLIPEYRELLRQLEIKVIQKQKSEPKALKHLLDCKLVFKEFFEKLALHHPFNVTNTAKIKTIKCRHQILNNYSTLDEKFFRRTAIHFIQSNQIPPISHNDIKTICEKVDPMELISSEEYEKLRAEKTIDPKIGYEISREVCEPLVCNKQYLPIASPTYQLCLPTAIAFERWTEFFTTEKHTIDRIPMDKLDEVRAYIHKAIEFFQPNKEKPCPLDFKEFMDLIDEWKGMLKEYMKNPVTVKPFPENPTLEFINEKSRFSEHLFPELTNIYKFNIDKNLNIDENERKNCKLVGFLAAFPKACLIFHNQKYCENVYGDMYCMLDIIVDTTIQKPKRCDLHGNTKDSLIEAIWKANGMVRGPDGGPVKEVVDQNIDQKTEAPKVDNSSNEESSEFHAYITSPFVSDYVKRVLKELRPEDRNNVEYLEEMIKAAREDEEMNKLLRWQIVHESSEEMQNVYRNLDREMTTLKEKEINYYLENESLKKENENLKLAKQETDAKLEQFLKLQEAEALKKKGDGLVLKEKLAGIKKELVSLREADERLVQENSNLKLDRQKLTSDNERLSRRLANTNQAVDVEKEVVELRKQLADSKKEAEGWKYNYEKVIKNDMMEESLEMLGIKNPVVYYTKFIEQGRNRLEEARRELKKFVAKSRQRDEKIRAEREFIDFEITVEALEKKAKMNLDILRVEPNCQLESLLKVEPYPMPFSSFIYSRMDAL